MESWMERQMERQVNRRTTKNPQMMTYYIKFSNGQKDELKVNAKTNGSMDKTTDGNTGRKDR